MRPTWRLCVTRVNGGTTADDVANIQIRTHSTLMRTIAIERAMSGYVWPLASSVWLVMHAIRALKSETTRLVLRTLSRTYFGSVFWYASVRNRRVRVVRAGDKPRQHRESSPLIHSGHMRAASFASDITPQWIFPSCIFPSHGSTTQLLDPRYCSHLSVSLHASRSDLHLQEGSYYSLPWHGFSSACVCVYCSSVIQMLYLLIHAYVGADSIQTSERPSPMHDDDTKAVHSATTQCDTRARALFSVSGWIRAAVLGVLARCTDQNVAQLCDATCQCNRHFGGG